MIIARSPMRLTLGGGGTDSPTFAADYGGFTITAAISKHVYITVNDSFTKGYLLRYSEVERAESIDDIKHPILREALRLYEIPPHVEIVSVADIPSGTGLGSSGTFTVALCKALAMYTGTEITQENLARQAANIELDILGRPGGQQDHWASALGGLQVLTFEEEVKACPLVADPGIIRSQLSLFFTGHYRDSETILSTQTDEGLLDIKRMGLQAEVMLCLGHMSDFGELMDRHWRMKLRRSPEMSNPFINDCYELAMLNGATGGKLVGAGGGGFLLFVTKNKRKLRLAMSLVGLQEVDFDFDYEGATALVE